VLTETWLVDWKAYGQQLPSPEYNHYYACREKRSKHGGVSVFIKSDVPSILLAKRVEPEIVVVSIGDKDLLMVACYASPGLNAHEGVNIYEEIAILI
jgi:hypothetical protein